MRVRTNFVLVVDFPEVFSSNPHTQTIKRVKELDRIIFGAENTVDVEKEIEKHALPEKHLNKKFNEEVLANTKIALKGMVSGNLKKQGKIFLTASL
jgi:hypothetical protein